MENFELKNGVSEQREVNEQPTIEEVIDRLQKQSEDILNVARALVGTVMDTSRKCESVKQAESKYDSPVTLRDRIYECHDIVLSSKNILIELRNRLESELGDVKILKF